MQVFFYVSAIIKDSRPSSFGPWAEDENPKNISGIYSYHKDLLFILNLIGSADFGRLIIHSTEPEDYFTLLFG
jgi:hypothetical protein